MEGDLMNTTNPLMTPILTDKYQLTMAYAYFKAGRHNEAAVFDLFFRKNPFGGEFTVFAGIEEVLRFVQGFKFTDEHLAYLRLSEPYFNDDAFMKYLANLDCSEVKIFAPKEGTLVFPRIPLIRVEGPLGITQLLETALLNLVNYPSLIATNASRFRLAAGPRAQLLEFGLRRAQGPDGGLSASRYAMLGGFDATSNVAAGFYFDVPVKGTHAHSFVQSFSSMDEIHHREVMVCDPHSKEDPQYVDFVETVLEARERLGFKHTNMGELAAFTAYAIAFPSQFLALVDTYDTLKSGIPNFLIVASALESIGYTPIGIRLDSGDLAYLSKTARNMFRDTMGESFAKRTRIVASNDINEPTLLSLNQQGHEIDVFGIGTHLVTCQAQPALGCVYKLVEINGRPCIKLSQDSIKITIPGKKKAYRLYGKDGIALLDVMAEDHEMVDASQEILCRHPFDETKRAMVKPTRVEALHELVWDGIRPHFPEGAGRMFVLEQLSSFRPDHLRLLNPTPYKVSVTESLYQFIHGLMDTEAPITHLE